MINLFRMRSKSATEGQLEVSGIPLPKGMGESGRDSKLLSSGWDSGCKARPPVPMES